MGTVYHAELRVPGGFRRPCAVKVIQQGGPDRDHFVARMRDEARLLGMLQDEQVLGVSELVLIEGRDAVIMEYVEGVDLSDLLRVHAVPPRALAELGAEIAGTLHRAHTARHPATRMPLNVIHRDVKPANVMVTARGGVRLLDFGVARAAFDSRESQTQGLVLGTLNYFPPEVLAGEDPTTAVDVYGLGITLWECGTAKEWGAPRVQQARFEKRVDQRLDQMPEHYGSLVPVLRQLLQWDPKLRPDGGVVERSLLHAADESIGQGLRTWAREVVPKLLAQNRKDPESDALLGKTIAIESREEQVGNDGASGLELGTQKSKALSDPAATFASTRQAAAAIEAALEAGEPVLPDPLKSQHGVQGSEASSPNNLVKLVVFAVVGLLVAGIVFVGATVFTCVAAVALATFQVAFG